MISPEQRAVIVEDPTRRQIVAYEPDDHQMKLIFRDVPSALVVVTPTRKIWKEDLFTPKFVATPAQPVVEQVPIPLPTKVVSAEHFVNTVAVNVDNDKLTDKDFRQFIRNTLPVVKF